MSDLIKNNTLIRMIKILHTRKIVLESLNILVVRYHYKNYEILFRGCSYVCLHDRG